MDNIEFCKRILKTIFDKSKPGNCYDEESQWFGFASYKQVRALKRNEVLVSADCFGHMLVSPGWFEFEGWKVMALENSRFNGWEIRFYKKYEECKEFEKIKLFEGE